MKNAKEMRADTLTRHKRQIEEMVTGAMMYGHYETYYDCRGIDSETIQLLIKWLHSLSYTAFLDNEEIMGLLQVPRVFKLVIRIKW